MNIFRKRLAGAMFQVGLKPLLFASLVLCSASFSLAQSNPGAEGNATTEESKAAPRELSGYEYRFPALGTLVSVKVYHHDLNETKKALERVEQRVLELNDILSDYDPESETSLLTSTAVVSPQAVSEDLWATLKASDFWYQRTGGAFDSSMGALTRLWRKSRRSKQVPSKERIQSALEQCGWEQVQLDVPSRKAAFKHEKIRLDFGGIGKGYIVDEAYEVLREANINCCLINISGNMRFGDPPPGRDGWRIEIAGLKRDGPPLRRIEISNCAIATSGDLWQFITIAGQRHSHILDPSTGYGVIGPIAATVLGESATDVDAFATAACILPLKQIQAIAAEQELKFLRARLDEEKGLEIAESEGFPK
ncbi:MAG: FAD:protein FMN transferase [Planctomycetota bacterium]